MRERTNEETLDLFADLLEPFSEILSDNAVSEPIRKGQKPIKAVKVAIKNHKNAVIEILALLDDKDPEEYKVNLFTLPVKLLELFSQPGVMELFIMQGRMSDGGSSGSAMENTEGDGQ